MRLYFAPLEGITKYVFRNAFRDFWGEGVDKYFAPFIAVTQNGISRSRVWDDIAPEHNEGIPLIPQLLGNQGCEAGKMAKSLADIGYQEINLNLGCPYATVVTKKKGAGLLAERDMLIRYLDGIFDEIGDELKISVKTRIGMSSPDEFGSLLEIYNQYPLEELIIHPRVREDFYEGKPNLYAFEQALEMSKAPVCYNGDIFTLEDYRRLLTDYPQVNRIMLGRGLLTNPGLLQEILFGEKAKPAQLQAFHDRIYGDYTNIMSGERNTLFKMKELWNYMQYLFEEPEKYMKKIHKAQRASEYEAAVLELFHNCSVKEGAGFELQS